MPVGPREEKSPRPTGRELSDKHQPARSFGAAAEPGHSRVARMQVMNPEA
jgi:hypothetical protein